MTSLSTTPDTLEITLPFSGFYHSIWDQALDMQTEYFAEHEAETMPADVDKWDICDLIHRHTDGNATLEIARAYPERFADTLEQETGLKIPFKFAAMTSPRFYNFETNRIFATIPKVTAAAMLVYSMRHDSHETLRDVINRRFTPRSGFIPFYSDDLRKWLPKPVTQWDHNELHTLLIAVIEIATGDDVDELEMMTYQDWPDSCYSEWEKGIEWDKLQPALDALRQRAAA